GRFEAPPFNHVTPRRRRREEDLAAAVVAHRAGAREPEAGAPSDALERARPERRVRRNHCDAASRRLGAAAAGQELPDRNTSEAKLARRAEVREHEHADGMAARDPARAPDPALPTQAAHAGARADRTLLERPSRRGGDGPPRVRGFDLDDASLAQVAVVALADDRDDDVVDADARVPTHRHLDRAVVDPA